MTYKTEFPDYPDADWPAMPQGFTDTSWHNDACPSIASESLGIRIFIDYAESDAREVPENGARYIAYRLDENDMPNDDVLTTDKWDDVLSFIARERAVKDSGIYVLNDDSEPRCGRIYHVMIGNERKAIAYDVAELQDAINNAIGWDS